MKHERLEEAWFLFNALNIFQSQYLLDKTNFGKQESVISRRNLEDILLGAWKLAHDDL